MFVCGGGVRGTVWTVMACTNNNCTVVRTYEVTRVLASIAVSRTMVKGEDGQYQHLLYARLSYQVVGLT